jgi:glycosyltransferase involved in cell wall biosynthesis
MENRPFFSIITATYNSGKTISDCIQSVLNQHFSDFEFILIDANSSDSTMTIIQSFENKFKEKAITFKYLSEPDNGIYDAWNKGVLHSQGKWISFLGSDDEYLPDALTHYFSEIEKNPKANYISSKVELIDSNKNKIRVFGKPFNWKQITRNMDIAQVGSFHKRELFEKVGKFNDSYKIVGDLEFYLRGENVIMPAYFDTVTAKMQNNGVSNQIYKALKEALTAKLKLQKTPSYLSYYDFYSSLAKCYIKILIQKK